MTFFVRLPEKLGAPLVPIKLGSRKMAPLTTLDDGNSYERAILLIPSSSMVFSTLPQPGRLMSFKQKLLFIRNNNAIDMLFDELRDELMIWLSDKETLVYSIVNKDLWRYWCQIIKASTICVGAIVPEWAILPWYKKQGPTLFAKLGANRLLRTGRWHGYSMPLHDNHFFSEDARQLSFDSNISNLAGLPINLAHVYEQLHVFPFPIKLRWKINKHYYLHRLKLLLSGFLLGVMAYQMVELYHSNKKLSSLSPLVTTSSQLQDRFYPLLLSLNKVGDKVQFQLTSINYQQYESQITMISYAPCSSVIKNLKLGGINIRGVKTMGTISPYQCNMSFIVSEVA